LLLASERMDLEPIYSFNDDDMWAAGMAESRGKSSQIRLWSELLEKMEKEQCLKHLEEPKTYGQATKSLQEIYDDMQAINNRKPSEKQLDELAEVLNEPKPEQSSRFNSGKVDASMMPMLGFMEVCKVSHFGGSKYDRNNYRKPSKMSEYLACIMRHYVKMMYAQEVDNDSFGFHAAHLAWNAMTIIEKMKTGSLIDDRYKYDNIDEILDDVCNLNEDQKAAIQVNIDKKEKK